MWEVTRVCFKQRHNSCRHAERNKFTQTSLSFRNATRLDLLLKTWDAEKHRLCKVLSESLCVSFRGEARWQGEEKKWKREKKNKEGEDKRKTKKKKKKKKISDLRWAVRSSSVMQAPRGDLSSGMLAVTRVLVLKCMCLTGCLQPRQK